MNPVNDFPAFVALAAMILLGLMVAVPAFLMFRSWRREQGFKKRRQQFKVISSVVDDLEKKYQDK